MKFSMYGIAMGAALWLSSLHAVIKDTDTYNFSSGANDFCFKHYIHLGCGLEMALEDIVIPPHELVQLAKIERARELRKCAVRAYVMRWKRQRARKDIQDVMLFSHL